VSLVVARLPKGWALEEPVRTRASFLEDVRGTLIPGPATGHAGGLPQFNARGAHALGHAHPPVGFAPLRPFQLPDASDDLATTVHDAASKAVATIDHSGQRTAIAYHVLDRLVIQLLA